MADFSFLKPYVLTEAYVDAHYEEVQFLKHSFLPVPEARLAQAEEKLGFSLPEELKAFYYQVGYGYLHQAQESSHNRLMYPLDVAAAYLRQGKFENGYLANIGLYEEPYKLLFYEAQQGCFAWLDLREKKPTSTVYYIGEADKVADSIEAFLLAYEAQPTLLQEFSATSRAKLR
ncbi:SMI1/KNR4 family protein [Hymenobacter bucti]|uniref:SMI1/KNR4 family protein n=1 Tax=Hymenobacter bucti TaxID=1844114 RepID=A0ABW4QXS8_9BACT